MSGLPEDAYAVVNGWSAVEAVGPDAGKFLQNFCTNDVLKLADGQSCEAMFTDIKAHVQAYAWVGRINAERFVVLLSSGRSDRLQEHLERYLIREKVELRLVPPGEWTIGRGVESALVVPIDVLGDGVAAALDAETPPGARLSDEAFERVRIGLGLPLDAVDVDDRNLPQEVDRDDRAISFTKGCYLGQEPVARIDALGRVNWLLRGLEVKGTPPAPGAEVLLEGRGVGRVTSSVAVDEGALALAFVRREQSEAGATLEVEGFAATVWKPPR